MMLILALTIHVIDGIQFVIIWASVLAATLFWYIDTPIRRIFRTHFLRHQDQYQIAYDFAAQSASAFSAEQSLQIAVLTASDAFQSEWAAAWSGFDAAHLVIVDHGSVRVVAASAAPIALLPAAPELAQPLGQDGTIGWLWVGKRMTAEPFDDQDVQLLALLSDYLTRMLLFHEQIRRLAEVPMLLIATEDRERRRLGLELHDRALGYLGGLPLMVGRARQLAGPHVPDDLQRIHTWIEHNAAQVANDLRTIILQLNPQDLSGVRFLPALHAMAGRLCDLSAVTLCWEMTGTWDTLDSTESLHLYRIVEQAITNALQHGQPTVVTISLAVESGQQCIIIHDNGGGFDLSLPIRTGHVGLESMRERARLLGATLEIESSPNNGTLLRLCLNHRIGSVDITNLYHGFEPASAHSPLQRRTIIAKRRWPVEIISVLGLILCVGIGAAAVLFARQTNCSANPAQEQRMIIRGQDSWIGTGICTKPGQHITIRYMSGSWTPNKDSLSNNPFVGAEGYASIMGSWTVSKDTPVGGLIGRIEDGPIHAIGREQTWITERAGELHLRMNDGDCGGCYNDNAGSIEVVITIAP
jgi:signal transduction histidine kinase